MKQILSVLVQNHPGVLVRVSGLFSSRGYNIESLAVGETEDPEVSRITLVVSGDESVLDQLIKQLSKLIEVIKVRDLKPEGSIKRELALVKVSAEQKQRQEIFELVNVFRAKIVDVTPTSMVLEVTGDYQKVEAIIDLVRPFGILELVRTGSVAITRGPETI